MTEIPTAHISATSKDEIANTVLMPGDPLRAKFIADTYLEDVSCFNETRGMLGYTGTYNGKKVSVMGSGMGTPSAVIYYYELFKFYDVENIIRIGTAGGLQANIEIKDIVIASASNTNSTIVNGKFGEFSFSPTPDFNLLKDAVDYAEEKDFRHHVGTVITDDEFYNENDPEIMAGLVQHGALAAEMESAGLYMTARRLGKKSLALFTVSDNEEEEASAEDRETAYTQMMELALTIAPE